MDKSETSKYEKLFGQAGLSAAHLKTIEWVGEDKTVLEVGCASGYISKLLKEKRCQVTAVEKDKAMAGKAQAFCKTILVGSIEDDRIIDLLKNRAFDVVIMNDILEHLAEPERVLLNLRTKFKEDGYLLLSLPNVANWEIRKNLFFRGQFKYQDYGVMDREHLRFFTFSTAIALIERARYEIIDYAVTGFSYLPFEGSLRKIGVRQKELNYLKERVAKYYPNFGGAHFLFKVRLK